MTGPQIFDLSGKVAIVTGSGRGLGRVIARGLADAGAAVVTCARTVAEAESAAAEIADAGGRAAATRVDVSQRESCQALVDFAVERFGRLDVMVNNAGIDIIKPAETVTEADFDTVLAINLKGYLHCSQLAALQMMKQGTGGSIINNSSIAGAIGIRGLLSYTAAKSAVDGITRVMAVEWAPRNIRVNAFAPGYFENIMAGATEEHARSEKEQQVLNFTAMHRRGRPHELIGPVVFLASDAASYVTGTVLYVDGGYTAM